MNRELKQRIDMEYNLIDDGEIFRLDQIYKMLDTKVLYFNELGGYYIPTDKYVVEKEFIKYNYEVNRPFFEFRHPSMNTNTIVWHTHPYQGSDVFNCYPSYEDMKSMSLHNDKIFILITKCGTFIYFSNLTFSSEFPREHYEYLQREFFASVETMSRRGSFINNKNYVLFFYDRLVPTHIQDVYKNLNLMIQGKINLKK